MSDLPTAKRLDTAIILEAALALAREPGAKSVTVRQLGTRLGADPTAIYRYYRSKDDLMRALLDSVLGIALSRVSVTPDDDWKAYLRESAEHTLDVFLEYPTIGSEAIRLNSGDTNELLSVEGILHAFASAGLDGEQSVRHYGVYSGFVLSFCSAVAGVRSVSSSEDAESPWIDHLAATKATHPHIIEHRDELLALRDRDIFRSTIELIIEDAARTAG